MIKNLFKKVRKSAPEVKIALAGVPNVGKSTVFNELTGLRRHTGNWTGKTVDCAEGNFVFRKTVCSIVDLPGTYSVFARSAEEKEAENYILNGGADVVLAVCDMTSPERSLPFALQILEITEKVVIFFNLADEAEKKNIKIDCKKLSSLLGVPVVSGSARNKDGIKEALDACLKTAFCEKTKAFLPTYPDYIEEKISETDTRTERRAKICRIYDSPLNFGFDDENEIRDVIASVFVSECDRLCREAVKRGTSRRAKKEIILDRFFTGKTTGFPVMALLITLLFWLTLKGANYPSEALWRLLYSAGEILRHHLSELNLPTALISFLADGIYGTTARVVSVMLIPMAIFFPLFTLLEDFGYLPRVAFNLDRCFKKCGGCGKQALCMCMGLGCNAVGISGCRIIDSKRERLIAIFTNSFIPCNGRFPIIITLIYSFVFTSSGLFSEIGCAVAMTGVLALSVGATLISSRILSKTILKGAPSSFTLELPPYRPPKIFKTVATSIVDRTFKVLLRAVSVAAPAGAVIWLFTNVKIGNSTPLSLLNSLLDPIGRLMGLDGTVLSAFILGLPANETVLPMALASYLSENTVSSVGAACGEILTANGWTLKTAVCAVIFTLFHWPCSTSLLTVKKETGSFKYMLFAAFLPTAFGFVTCSLVNLFWSLVALIF